MSKLPEWFDGELYEKGDTVTNRFSGEEYKLSSEELSMYDFIMGAQMVKDMRKGLEWFKENNSEAYMVLLD